MKKSLAPLATGSRNKTFVVSDGELILRLRPAGGGWYAVTSPFDPAITTQARSVEEAFLMAYDAQEALKSARAVIASRFGGSPARPDAVRAGQKTRGKAAGAKSQPSAS